MPASSPPSAPPTPAASAPTASTPPLSPFEADPAVQGFRANQVAVADVINANNLGLPELNALSTAARQAQHQKLYGYELGRYSPGPTPATILAVREPSDTRHTLALCGIDAGSTLLTRGGAPAEPRKVLGANYEMVLEAGVWKVDSATLDSSLACANASIVEVPSP